jgi:hypothetical protein
MRFIRAYWGDLKAFNGRHKQEIEIAVYNRALNEKVYVWGKNNYAYIKEWGFDCEYMGEFNRDYVDDSHVFMFPKLWALKAGVLEFGEVVFLDWDCMQVRDLDDQFWHLLRQREIIQMPLYSYPHDYLQRVRSSWINIPEKENQYLEKQFATLRKYHYAWNKDMVTPNAGFIYCRDIEGIEALIDILTFSDIDIAIEEMGFYVYAKRNCKTVEEYIPLYEPLVASAKENNHFNQGALNKLLMPEKTLYFQHS